MCYREILFFGVILQTTLVSPIAEIGADDEVLHLIGEPDFRDVRLRWEYGQADEDTRKLLAFQIHYCELQAWGQYRCRTKVVENSEEERTGRMVDNHYIEASNRTSWSKLQHIHYRVTNGDHLLLRTRATQCLPHASEVEVSTGPYFGGRIAVEAADGGPERCSIQGNPNSAQDAYILRIHHDECGSDVNETTVATYVIVQENLPILTHSTRRFLVLCSYKPETLTVRAGINLPKSSPGDVLLEARPLGTVEPFNDLDNNNLQPARLEARKDDSTQSMFGEITLVMFLVVTAFVGLGLLVWKMLPQAHKDDMSIASISSLSRSSIFSGRNRDRFSDKSSVYSITLSEKDEDVVKKQGDNTSEA
ncbi:unnamed protein product [Leptosia nina]|uniref:ZP domain-containing protein n=1 Tax=Leptosia nina TaxID=320188 RepID=A0AAV1JN83_9NEOP